MAPKKGGRGTKMSLAQFAGPQIDDQSLDWAISHPSEDSGAVLAGDVGKKGAAAAAAERKDFSVKPGEIRNFRDLPQERSDKYVDPHMKPPYTGFVTNLPFGIDGESLRQALESETGIDSVKNVTIANRGTALVEFASVDALHLGVMTSGKNIQGRQINVGVATEEQKSMPDGGPAPGGRNGGRGGDKQQQQQRSPGDAFAGGRDSMGAQQPSFNSRSTDRSEAAADRALSRDLIGSSSQPERHGMGGVPQFPAPIELGDDARTSLFGSVQQKPARSPVSSGAGATASSPVTGGGGFGDWRSTEATRQPETRSSGSPAPAGGPRTPAATAPAAPTPAAGTWRGGSTDGPSWRDSAPTQQPQRGAAPAGERPSRDPKPATPSPTASAPTPAAPAAAGGWRDTAPEVPKAVLKKK